jgi:predicted esterase
MHKVRDRVPLKWKRYPRELGDDQRYGAEVCVNGDDGGDERKLYCLIGNRSESSIPKKLLVVMPGGDGSSKFSPFIRRLYKHALDDSWMVAQIVAPKWSRTQQQRVVWPLQSDDYPEVELGTDELFDVVVDDITGRAPIDQKQIHLLAWSSSGPAAYRIALRDEPRLAGAFIAMSVFKKDELSRSTSGICPAIYLLQSPDDRITRFQDAEAAKEYLTSLGRRVALTEYAGGHGWHGNPYQMVSQGVAWLTRGCSAEPSGEPELPITRDTNP